MLTRPIFSYFHENLHFMNFNLQNSIILIENLMKTLSFCFQKGIIQSLIWNLPFFPLPKYYKLQVCHFQISSNKNFCEIYNWQKNIQLLLNKGFDTTLHYWIVVGACLFIFAKNIILYGLIRYYTLIKIWEIFSKNFKIKVKAIRRFIFCKFGPAR